MQPNMKELMKNYKIFGKRRAKCQFQTFHRSKKFYFIFRKKLIRGDSRWLVHRCANLCRLLVIFHGNYLRYPPSVWDSTKSSFEIHAGPPTTMDMQECNIRCLRAWTQHKKQAKSLLKKPTNIPSYFLFIYL